MAMQSFSCRYAILCAVFVPISLSLLFIGCHSTYHKAKADQEVYSLIHGKSRGIEGMPSWFGIEHTESPYWTSGIGDATQVLSLNDAITTAVENSRDYKSRGEILYSQGLNLSSARHEFEPQYFGTGEADLINDDANKTLSGYLSLGMNRMLETGTDVSVGLTSNLFRIISGDDPARILASAFSASVAHPLIRGAGRNIVMENLTQEERDMVYAIRDFVRFRKEFTVGVAQSYYSLLNRMDRVRNAERNYLRLSELRKEIEARYQAGWIAPFEVDQALQQEFSGRVGLIQEVTGYENALDGFKMLLGIPIETVVRPDADALVLLVERGVASNPISEEEAVFAALDNRLDLKNSYGRLEDAKRRVAVSEDALKPLLDLVFSYQADSDGRTETFDFRDGDKLYQIGVDLDLPLDTKIQRNVFRQSIVNVAAAQRGFLEASEGVKQEVRVILRRLKEAEENYNIQRISLRLAENRSKREPDLLKAGWAGVTVRDVLDAQDALLREQNALTQVLVDHFNTTLDLYLAMETLKVRDDGLWADDLVAVSQN